MQCINHPEAQAVDRCAGCQESFCPDCLVEIHGRNYCGSCKVTAVQAPFAMEAAIRPCGQATVALVLAILSPLCLIGLAPTAIILAIIAKNKIAADPHLTGSGKATAALIISITLLSIWLLIILAAVISKGS